MSNPYALFLNLLPKQSKYIGKVLSVDSITGTVTLERIGGNQHTIVKGGTDSYAVDEYVFIVDGVIVSKLDSVQTILEEAVI